VQPTSGRAASGRVVSWEVSNLGHPPFDRLTGDRMLAVGRERASAGWDGDQIVAIPPGFALSASTWSRSRRMTNLGFHRFDGKSMASASSPTDVGDRYAARGPSTAKAGILGGRAVRDTSSSCGDHVTGDGLASRGCNCAVRWGGRPVLFGGGPAQIGSAKPRRSNKNLPRVGRGPAARQACSKQVRKQ